MDSRHAVAEMLIERLTKKTQALGPLRAVDVPIIKSDVDALRNLLSDARRAERLTEALTPSGETKSAYIGEFTFKRTVPLFEGEEDECAADLVEEIGVPWTTVKEIMKAIRERAERAKP